MSKSIKAVAWSLACVLGAVALAGCGSADSSAKQDDQALGTMAEELANTGSTSGDGFVCGPTADGGTGCVCWEGDTSPIYSCDGMMSFCDLIGPGMTCNPFDNTCSCRTWIKSTVPSKSAISVSTGNLSKLSAP